VSLVAADGRRVLSRSRGKTVNAVELVINVRAQGEPDALRDAFERAFSAWGDAHGVEIYRTELRSLSPSRPVPTHAPGPHDRVPVGMVSR